MTLHSPWRRFLHFRQKSFRGVECQIRHSLTSCSSLSVGPSYYYLFIKKKSAPTGGSFAFCFRAPPTTAPVPGTRHTCILCMQAIAPTAHVSVTHVGICQYVMVGAAFPAAALAARRHGDTGVGAAHGGGARVAKYFFAKIRSSDFGTFTSSFFTSLGRRQSNEKL